VMGIPLTPCRNVLSPAPGTSFRSSPSTVVVMMSRRACQPPGDCLAGAAHRMDDAAAGSPVDVDREPPLRSRAVSRPRRRRSSCGPLHQ
jgi:hypothetical protein